VRLLWLGGVLAVLTLAAQPAAAVTSWEPVSGDIHEADAAIIPANLVASGLDSYEPDEGASAAVPLRVNAAPQDHTLIPREQDWCSTGTAPSPPPT
jgi:hypothetical protein